ncbi:hypothetical protein HDU76_002210 [Blyttiomyces sp. JEL0837]|nr:hypothetical protein HDU76_002210 [Blyttiomyces sp. JEL0837]
MYCCSANVEAAPKWTAAASYTIEPTKGEVGDANNDGEIDSSSKGVSTVPTSKSSPLQHRANITLAIFLPYSIGDFYQSTMNYDAQIELAVNETNADPSILPDTFVKLARFNSWDPLGSREYSFLLSGGYTALQAENASKSGSE